MRPPRPPRGAFWTYNMLLHGGAPFLVPYLALRAWRKRGRLEGLGERLGWGWETVREAAGERPVLWIHAVSVGEALVAAPLIRALRDRIPQSFLLVTTVTPTGRTVLQERCSEVDALRYFPLDFPWAVASILEAVRPVLYVALETELWPNLFFILQDRGIPFGLLNGRLSEASYRRYARFRWFMKQVLQGVSFLGMQSQADAARIQALGAPADRIQVMGNLKYDGVWEVPEEECQRLRTLLGLREEVPIWVCGSTHEGEEAGILQVFRRIRTVYPDLRLILVPRHPERFEGVARLLAREGFPWGRLSQPRDLPQPWSLLLGDTLGQLRALYGLATVAFVGGSLVPVGGHNLLEPAAWGCPVLFGPHVMHFSLEALRLTQAEGGIKVKNLKDLEVKLNALLEDPGRCQAMGQAARSVVEEHRGALGRALALLEPYLPEGR